MKLGNYFNRQVIKWPIKLEKIEFGWNFNQNIDNLPDGVKEIILKNSFSQ